MKASGKRGIREKALGDRDRPMARLRIAAAAEAAIAGLAVCVGTPPLAFLAPAVAAAMLLPLMRTRFLAASAATASFVPDPGGPDFAALSALLAECAERAAAGEGDSMVLLAPLLRDGGFVPYEMTVRPGTGDIVVRCGETERRRRTDAPLRPRCQLPLRVALEPVALEVAAGGGAAVLRVPQPLVRPHMERPRHVGAQGLAYRLYAVALLAFCAATGKTLLNAGAQIAVFALLPVALLRAWAFRVRAVSFARVQLRFAMRLLARFAGKV